MKSLSNYTEEKTTQLFNEMGAFFAFSNSQLEEGKKEGVVYCSMGHGLICPKGKAKRLFEELEKVHTQGIEQDKAENGKDAIIERELYNYEAFYTGEIEDTVDALECYGYTEQEIYTVYLQVLPTVD